MQQISNKILISLLLTAIAVSVIGTMVSLNRINQLLQIPITGMASSGTGMVNVSIGGVTSITATDALISFGSCSPNATYGSNLSSNDTSASWGSPGVCGTNGPNNITIQNDGNRNLNVSVQINRLAKDFIGGDIGGVGQAEMWFITRNATTDPGCYNTSIAGHENPPDFDGTQGLQYTWKNISSITDTYLACANLTKAKQFSLFAKVFIPANAPATSGDEVNVTLTFTGTNW